MRRFMSVAFALAIAVAAPSPGWGSVPPVPDPVLLRPIASPSPVAREPGSTPSVIAAYSEALWRVTSGRWRAPTAADASDDDLNRVTRRMCTTCHNDRLRTSDLSLGDFDIARAHEDRERAEAVIRKLRLGMMPPPGIPRAGGDTMIAIAERLEERIDAGVRGRPEPGSRVFQRLNRAEYARAVEELLGLQVDAGAWLPLDSYLGNFDNMADAQALSPTLLNAYLTAAGTISRIAVGDPAAPASHITYRQSPLVSQHTWEHMDGAPFGSRGGLVVTHDFPADGEYVFDIETRSGTISTFEDIDLSLNREPLALLSFEPGLASGNRGGGYPLRTEPIFVRAGQHSVAVSFVRRFEGPYEDILRPHRWSLAGEGESSGFGVTSLPHIWNLTISGPHNPTGVSDTEARRRIFSCVPRTADDELPCAREIVGRLATQAYRRPVEGEAMEGLLGFYAQGAEEGGFENGIRLALQATLASPAFIFRIEREPEGLRAGESYPVADLELASRLSFFLWGSSPDAELLREASAGRLNNPAVLRAQALRMLGDPRSEALARRFASQWLRLQDMDNIRPDPFWFPDFSENLARDLRTETQLLFLHLLREDRSILELFSADYSFLNQRLAEHYGIPGVSGDRFRPVAYTGEVPRRGILGHGSVLMLTSMGNRTSPVLRGKWVMEVLMGSPPPPPPPLVPDLEQTSGVEGGRVLTTRERMAIHRDNPACSSCHVMMDPIGVALDNFDVLGRWRLRESGIPVDTRGDFHDGSPVNGPAELADALLRRPIPLVRSFTEYLMSYAVARPVRVQDQPSVRAIVREAESSGYSLSSLVLGVVLSDPFRLRQVEGVTQQTESTDGE
jgi:hypothetical protein